MDEFRSVCRLFWLPWIGTWAAIAYAQCPTAQAPGTQDCFPGNKVAQETSMHSDSVRGAYAFLQEQAKMIGDTNSSCSVMDASQRKLLREQTVEALSDKTCIQHRKGLSQKNKAEIIDKLIKADFITKKDATDFVQKLVDSGFIVPQDGVDLSPWVEAGVFPPISGNEHDDCPPLPQPITAAPGSYFGGHHSYPGGLIIHEANNERIAMNLYQQNLDSYGGRDANLCRDLLIAAPIWHDWAKPIVFQWDKHGKEFPEMSIAGTSAHHILGLAETIKRGLPPVFIITQASAHGCGPQSKKCDETQKETGEEQVADWIRAAAIIAGVDDPIVAGYLRKDQYFGRYHIASTSAGWRAEYFLHNLSDADYHYSEQAVASVEAILKKLARELGFADGDYINRFRNPVLSNLTAEHIWMVYNSPSGIEGVKRELGNLCDLKNKLCSPQPKAAALHSSSQPSR